MIKTTFVIAILAGFLGYWAITGQAALINQPPNSTFGREVKNWVIVSNAYQKKLGSTNQITEFGEVIHDTKTNTTGFLIEWTGVGNPVCAFVIVTNAELHHPTGVMLNGQDYACSSVLSLMKRV